MSMQQKAKSLFLVLTIGVGCSSVPSAKLDSCVPAAAAGHSAPAVKRASDGIVVHVGEGFLKLEVCASNVIRVAYA